MGAAYIQGIIILTGINLIAVLGLSVLTGFTGLFSFGHAGFMAIGAYVSAIVTTRMNLPFPIALLASALGAGLVSFFIGRLTLKLKGDYFCIATLGFGEAVRLILNNWHWAGGARGWDNLPATVTVWNTILVSIIAVVLVWNLINSRHGRNMVAVREEELAAQMAGINVFRYKIIALIVSAALAGISGSLMAHYQTYITPKLFNMIKSTDLTIIVIFGGLGSISGTVVGTILLTALPEVFRAFSQWRLVFYGLAVIVIMVGRPKGIMGGQEFSLRSFLRCMGRQYLDFAGKAGRKEYWSFNAFGLLAFFGAALLDLVIEPHIGFKLAEILLGAALLTPWLAVNARRLHDHGKPGAFALVIIPFVGALWYALSGAKRPSAEQEPARMRALLFIPLVGALWYAALMFARAEDLQRKIAARSERGGEV